MSYRLSVALSVRTLFPLAGQGYVCNEAGDPLDHFK
jgi:hypothetical protein